MRTHFTLPALPSMACIAACAALGLFAVGFAAKEGAPSTATPGELVATYETLADSILAVKNTESKLVKAILATTYGHASRQAEIATAALKGGDSKAGAALQDLAALVAQLGTEGDNAVARVRKRLLEGGHHHNAAGEAQGIYDEGYVIVTKTWKKKLLDASKVIAALPSSGSLDALSTEWKKVQSTWAEIAAVK